MGPQLSELKDHFDKHVKSLEERLNKHNWDYEKFAAEMDQKLVKLNEMNLADLAIHRKATQIQFDILVEQMQNYGKRLNKLERSDIINRTWLAQFIEKVRRCLKL